MEINIKSAGQQKYKAERGQLRNSPEPTAFQTGKGL